MGGFMLATGALTVLAACHWLAKRERGTFAALVVAGSASVGLMSAINFLLHSDFRWLLLLPALLWLLGLACYLRES
jgi:CHASE2 domain-containing sensor protein